MTNSAAQQRRLRLKLLSRRMHLCCLSDHCSDALASGRRADATSQVLQKEGRSTRRSLDGSRLQNWFVLLRRFSTDDGMTIGTFQLLLLLLLLLPWTPGPENPCSVSTVSHRTHAHPGALVLPFAVTVPGVYGQFWDFGEANGHPGGPHSPKELVPNRTRKAQTFHLRGLDVLQRSQRLRFPPPRGG